MNDAVRRVRAGDKGAYREVVREYGALIRAFLASHLQDDSAIDDLAQQTFIVAFDKLGEFDPSTNLALWLKGIARYEVLMHLRRLSQHGKALERLRSRALMNLADDVSRLTERDGPSALDKLRDCLGKLPERVREALEARHLGGERVSAIAARSGSSVTAVSSLLFRGRRLLRDCLELGS